MRKFLLSLMFAMFATLGYAQTRTHMVRQGESLESIADMYGLSVFALLHANPDFTGEVYPGLAMAIPQTDLEGKRRFTSGYKGVGSFVSELGFQYLGIGGDTKEYYKSFNYGIFADFGYRYFLTDYLFAEGLIGGRYYALRTNDVLHESSTKIVNITLPIHVGVRIPVSETFSIRPYLGPRLDVPLSNKINGNNWSESVDTKAAVTAEFGLDFHFNRFGIRVDYGLGLGSLSDIHHVSLGVVYGI